MTPDTAGAGGKSISPHSLAELIESEPDAENAWRPQELASLLRHQMSAAVGPDLEDEHPSLGKRIRASDEAQALWSRSFGHVLLEHPNPPVELLQAIKDFAKANHAEPDTALPRQIGWVLYFASIIAARVRLGQRISNLDDEALSGGVQWVLSQPWADEGTRDLMRQGLVTLK